MATIALPMQTRTASGNQLRQLRAEGLMPGVIYGHRVSSRSVAMPQREFLRVWKLAGESTLVDLVVDGGHPVKALIQDVQRHPVTRDLLHVDFHQVNLQEMITARIKLQFVGIAPAVKELGGVLMTNLTELQVSCLPESLVHEITVSLAPLKTFSEYLQVRDLMLPAGITAVEKPQTVVAHVVPPRSEAELKELEQQPAAPTAAEVPVAGKEPKKENAPESAAAAAPAKGNKA